MKSKTEAGADGRVSSNIRKIVEMEREQHRELPLSVRIGHLVAQAAGTLRFILFHVAWFVVWIVLNTGLIPGVRVFDPYPFTFLTFCVSLEAIILSSFVLISQNRMSRQADERAHLDLQINLLAEEESTQTLQLLRRMCEHLGLPTDGPESPDESLVTRTDPESVAREIHRELDT